MKDIYPANKAHFKRLVPLAQGIIKLCRENNVDPIIYGSFAHFYHTKDKKMKVNDLDLIIPKKDFEKIARALRKEGFNTNYIKSFSANGMSTIIVANGKLKVELDEVGTGYKTLKEDSLSEEIFNKIDFYGLDMRIISLEHLEDIYATAFNRSRDDKAKIKMRIGHLEKFLNRKIKNDIQVEIKKNKNLSQAEKNVINDARIKEWGEGEKKDFDKDFEPNTEWFFIKDKKKIVALGGLRPVRVNYLAKKYSILGICSIISLEKGKGYGKILMSFMIDYSHRTGKTLLGFTTQTDFFKKAELGIEKDFIKRFVYVKPNGEKVYDDVGDGIYFEGKDKFISKVLKTKSPVYIGVLHW